MRGNGVYLEAPSRTQELLNIKWTLQSAGFRIGVNLARWPSNPIHFGIQRSLDTREARTATYL